MNANERVFGREDFRRWLDQQAQAIFGVSGDQFLLDYRKRRFVGRPVADDLASVIPLVDAAGG